jgi:hypothetical protein
MWTGHRRLMEVIKFIGQALGTIVAGMLLAIFSFAKK